MAENFLQIGKISLQEDIKYVHVCREIIYEDNIVVMASFEAKEAGPQTSSEQGRNDVHTLSPYEDKVNEVVYQADKPDSLKTQG